MIAKDMQYYATLSHYMLVRPAGTCMYIYIYFKDTLMYRDKL